MKKVLLSLFLLVLFIPVIKGEELNNLAPSAKSAILIEASTGNILFEKNTHEKSAPASMTKMMSMLLIIENIENGNLKWDENIKISANAAGMGGSQIYLEAGETMTVQDLFKGIAVGSANDATMALAERIAGTEASFVDLMNQKAKALGLKDTNFKNCHGLDVAIIILQLMIWQ
jgi:D-alanyl-D-alanine carboxypeptidase (penicillin-binding protein 5/6)